MSDASTGLDLASIFQRVARQGDPIAIEPAERSDQMVRWRGLIERLDGVRLVPHPGDRDPRSPALCRFRIIDPNDGDQTPSRDAAIRVEMDRSGELHLRSGGRHSATLSIPLVGEDQIAAVVDQVRSHHRGVAARRRRQRVADHWRMDSLRQAFGDAGVNLQVEVERCEDTFVITLKADRWTAEMVVATDQFAATAASAVQIVSHFTDLGSIDPPVQCTVSFGGRTSPTSSSTPTSPTNSRGGSVEKSSAVQETD